MKNTLLTFLFSIFTGFSALLFSQDMLNQPVPIDTAMLIGKLENGITYYIRHNEEPKERASFYLIQNVGALLENDSQNGLAHFLEHMAFNGTKNFPGKGIINYMEQNGLAFGADINAYTAYNETVYNLSSVPVRDGLIDSSLLVLHDWSNYLLLTNEEIDAERGVISEEWRTRRDASFRMSSQFIPVLTEGSMYAVRDVIGDLEVINNFDYDTLRQFYHDWYRSDLQAIAVVGDVNVYEMEKKIIELFSKIPAVENPLPRPFFSIPEHKETRFVLASDKEATSTNISIFTKLKGPELSEKNLQYLKEGYIRRLFIGMSSERISEILQSGIPPFISGGVSYSSFVRGYDIGMISVTVNPGQEEKGLYAMYTEAQRIVQHGFTESELDRAKINLLKQFENQYKQRDKISNDRYMGSIKQHFLTNEPLISSEFSWEFAQKVIPNITVEEVSSMAKKYFTNQNRVIVVKGPEDEDVNHMKKEEVLSIMDEVENAKIDPFVDSGVDAELINEELLGSPVISTKKLKQFDAVEWTLANNAKVVYKYADFDKNSITFQAKSDGGNSLIEANDLPLAMMLGDFVSAFGVGDLDAITLKKALAGKTTRVKVSLGTLTESIYGNAAPQDFETMMKLVYLHFANPRFDEQAFEALISRYISTYANNANNPQMIISDSIKMILTNYNDRTVLFNSEILEKIRFEDIEKLYRDRFKDAGDFIFFIVGNIEEDIAKEMAVKYIGSIKDDFREETWVDNNVRSPSGKTEKEILIPLETKKATIYISFDKETDCSPESILKLSVLEGILRLRYTEEIREKEGGTYGVGVGSFSQEYPYMRKQLFMNFDADPGKADYLKSIIYTEIDKIIQNGPTQEDLDKVVRNLLKEREQSKNNNNYWYNTIIIYYRDGYNRDSEENFENILNRLNPESMKEFASTFFENGNIIDLVFKPNDD